MRDREKKAHQMNSCQCRDGVRWWGAVMECGDGVGVWRREGRGASGEEAPCQVAPWRNSAEDVVVNAALLNYLSFLILHLVRWRWCREQCTGMVSAVEMELAPVSCKESYYKTGRRITDRPVLTVRTIVRSGLSLSYEVTMSCAAAETGTSDAAAGSGCDSGISWRPWVTRVRMLVLIKWKRGQSGKRQEWQARSFPTADGRGFPTTQHTLLHRNIGAVLNHAGSPWIALLSEENDGRKENLKQLLLLLQQLLHAVADSVGSFFLSFFLSLSLSRPVHGERGYPTHAEQRLVRGGVRRI